MPVAWILISILHLPNQWRIDRHFISIKGYRWLVKLRMILHHHFPALIFCNLPWVQTLHVFWQRVWMYFATSKCKKTLSTNPFQASHNLSLKRIKNCRTLCSQQIGIDYVETKWVNQSFYFERSYAPFTIENRSYKECIDLLVWRKDWLWPDHIFKVFSSFYNLSFTAFLQFCTSLLVNVLRFLRYKSVTTF